MGSASSCFHVADTAESLNDSDNGKCPCLSHNIYNKVMENALVSVTTYTTRFFFSQCFGPCTSMPTTFTALIGGQQRQALPPTNQAPVSTTSIVPLDTITSVPRILPLDGNSRPSDLQQDGLVARDEIGTDSLHSHKCSQELRISYHKIQEHANEGDQVTGGESTDCFLGSSLKLSVKEVESGYGYESSEDKDVCPTCLDGNFGRKICTNYNTENPRIATKCSHHYHLSCIYEWLERSKTCPVCSKEMIFEETT